MSDEFLKLARQEIQSEIDSLRETFLICTNDEQFYKKSRDIEKHIHKIKGLAPMMNQEKVGEIAVISDAILKHVTNHGMLNGSHRIISEAVQIMNHLLNGDTSMGIDDFRKKAINVHPDITGF